MTRRTGQYGSWASPITSAILTSAGIAFSELAFSEGRLYWLESRPDEAGRVVLVSNSGDVSPKGFNLRTRAHEYGGGAWFVHGETVFFTNFTDQRLYRQDPGSDPRPITPAPPSPASLRHADGRVTPDGRTIICIRE